MLSSSWKAKMVDERSLDDRLRYLERTLGISRASWASDWKYRLDDIVRRISELERAQEREQRRRSETADLLVLLLVMAAGPGLMLLLVLVGR